MVEPHRFSLLPEKIEEEKVRVLDILKELFSTLIFDLLLKINGFSIK